MADPLSLIALGAAVGGAAGKFTEKAWDAGERWLKQFFRDHAPAANEAAQVNSARFLLELAQRIKILEDSQRVSGDTIDSAQDNPQFSVILQRAILGASQTENSEKHRLLAQLVAERLAVPPESTFALAVKLACDAVAVLNSAQLRLLALAVALHEIRPRAPMPADDYRQWLDGLLAPVLSPYLHDHAEYKEIDVLHLSALGCVTYDRTSERALEWVLSIKNGLFKGGFAFDYPSFKESDLGWYLDHIWVEGFAGVSLTSIGSVIGGLVFDELSGVRVGHPHWARDDRGVSK